MSVAEIINKINETKPFISGITVSGGEASLRTDFLLKLFRAVKKLGLSTFLDTNGSILLEEKQNFLKYLDMVMIDSKSFNSVEHKDLTGCDNTNVIKNIKFLARAGKLYEVRTVIVPELLDNYHNVDQISKLLAGLDENIRYKLIKYRSVGVRSNKMTGESPEQNYMEELAALVRSNGCQNIVVV
jgi:pyruvate-formate lyase-activating enzyme